MRSTDEYRLTHDSLNETTETWNWINFVTWHLSRFKKIQFSKCFLQALIRRKIQSPKLVFTNNIISILNDFKIVSSRILQLIPNLIKSKNLFRCNI